MSTKKNRRDLPPLLPLEYCSIERAARMLECETEDILHWFEIGSIELMFRFNDHELTGDMLLDRNSLKWFFENGACDFFHPLRDQKEGFWWTNPETGLFLTFDLTENLGQLENILTNICNDETGDTETVLANVNVQGFLHIPQQSLINSNRIKSPVRVFEIPKAETAIFFHAGIEVNEIFIDRNNLAKIYSAIISGEQIQPIKDKSETAAKRLAEASSRPAENNSPKRSLALMSLCEYAIKSARLDPDLFNRPDALTTAINKELAKLGITEIEGAKTLYNAFQVAIPYRKEM